MACPWDSLSSHESRNKESDRLQSRRMPSKSCSQRRLSADIVWRNSTQQSREGLRERHHSQRREEPEKGFSTACCIYSFKFRSPREVTRLWSLINTLETCLLLYRESYVGFCLSDPMLKCWQFKAKGLWERIRNLDFLNSGAALNPVHMEQYILWITKSSIYYNNGLVTHLPNPLAFFSIWERGLWLWPPLLITSSMQVSFCTLLDPCILH